jgi:uncharacterized protein YecT (DUF1311 family)
MPHRIPSIAGAAAAAAALMLICAAVAIAAGAHTAALSPPVIHETFTPLPCGTGSTTVQMEGCAEQKILADDKQIDTLNREIFATLTGTAARKRFIAGHKAWFAYRQAFCASESDIFEGGTEAPVEAAQCEAAVDAQHVKDLKGFLHSFG